MRLAQALLEQGKSVFKVNYTLGDALYWRGTAIACRASLENLNAFYQEMFDRYLPTDIVLFGDCRPVHIPAVQVASSLGIEIHVFEEGYFRPDWITLETKGVNGFSLLPKIGSWYRSAATHIQRDNFPLALPSGFKARVIHDIGYNTACIANPLFYPNYPSHINDDICSEYLAYARRIVRVRRTRFRDTHMVQALAQTKNYFILVLQVRGDSQLRFHSSYADSEKLLREVLSSFAAHAPSDARLIVKNHPLDPGFTNHADCVSRLAGQLDISDRVVYLETGHLPTLLDHARGLVTVNSTTIGQALFHHCPVKALGRSIFDLDGLIYQDHLDVFWKNPGIVDIALFENFKKVVMYLTQINGGLYSSKGIALAVKNAVPRLLEANNRLEKLQKIVLSRSSKFALEERV